MQEWDARTKANQLQLDVTPPLGTVSMSAESLPWAHPYAGCGLVAATTFEPREIITAYHGELFWMPAVTAKASMTTRIDSHFKQFNYRDGFRYHWVHRT